MTSPNEDVGDYVGSGARFDARGDPIPGRNGKGRPVPAAELLPDGVELDTELANAHRLLRDFSSRLKFNPTAPGLAFFGTGGCARQRCAFCA